MLVHVKMLTAVVELITDTIGVVMNPQVLYVILVIVIVVINNYVHPHLVHVMEVLQIVQVALILVAV